MRFLLAALLMLPCTGCAVIARREHATVTPAASPSPGATDEARSSASELRREWPDAIVDVRVLGSKGSVTFIGLLLPIIPLPSQDFDGPSPWLKVTVTPRAGSAALVFDASAIALETPDGHRYRPLLLTAPLPPDQCDFGPHILGPDSIARLGSTAFPTTWARTVLDGAGCFDIAFRLPPGTAPRYLLHIPRPVAASGPEQGTVEPWIVCVRPRATWEGDFAPFMPLFGPTWTFLQTRGRADFGDCPAVARPPS